MQSEMNDIMGTASKIMEAAGLDPAQIYAFQKTGLLCGENSSDEHKQEWAAAMNEYYENQSSAGEPETTDESWKDQF